MDLLETSEQAELRRTLREFLGERAPEAAVRTTMETVAGYDTQLWKELAAIGIQSIGIPERFGGAGYGWSELSIVFEETGAALLCAPLLGSTGLATSALLHSGDEQACARYLPDIAAGVSIATLALVERGGDWSTPASITTAERTASGWRLHGEKIFVLDAHVADLLLVSALTDDGPALFTLAGASPGLEVTVVPTLDRTRRLTTVSIADVKAEPLGQSGDATAVVQAALNCGVTALAAEQTGGCAAVLQMSVEYAKLRRQFDRSIGSFQAIKHKCADMLVDVEGSRSLTRYAARVADEEPSALPLAASMAQAYCAESYLRCAAEAIQIHGGIGFTWEHPAHLYYRRARSSEALFGSPAQHREVLAGAIIEGAEHQ